MTEQKDLGMLEDIMSPDVCQRSDDQSVLTQNHIKRQARETAGEM